ncbi:MAG: hypothetical protein AAGG44_19860, partial [Planctomycetota bacterium]
MLSIPVAFIALCVALSSVSEAADKVKPGEKGASNHSTNTSSADGFIADPAEGYRLLTTKAYLPA